MSDINVTVEIVREIVPHPQADRLEIAKILGTQTIVPKGQYKAGDFVIYFPPDICLPADVSVQLGVDKYLKHALFDGKKIACKVAACRLRGTPSYGFVAPITTEQLPRYVHEGEDVTARFGAIKYEPPVRVQHGGGTGEVWGNQEREPDNFHHYTDIQAHWKHHRAFAEGQLVRITEKVHGTNSRVALLKVEDEWRFFAGSHKTAKRQVDPHDRESVYWHPFELPGVMDMLTDLCGMDDEPTNDVILFGELYGPGVQDLDYGIPAGEIGWRVYDCSVNGRYLDSFNLVTTCLFYGIPLVPVLYTGPFSLALVDEFTNGPTHMAKTDDIHSLFKGREGIVITPLVETYSPSIGGRLILKSVSADYRDRKGARDEGDL